MDAPTKILNVDRKNPLIRIPASLFKHIDKRKRKIPITVTTTENAVTIKINKIANKAQ